MFRVSIVAAVAALLSACHPQPNPTLPQASGDVCLAPLANGASDPQPRDIHMKIDPDKTALYTSMCIVSNATRSYGQFTAEVTVFTQSGEFTSSGSNSVYYISPAVGNVPPTPSMRASLQVNVPIDPKYVNMGLSQSVMIRLSSYPCVGGTDTGTACKVDAANVAVTTFVRDLAP